MDEITETCITEFNYQDVLHVKRERGKLTGLEIKAHIKNHPGTKLSELVDIFNLETCCTKKGKVLTTEIFADGEYVGKISIDRSTSN